MNKKAQQAKAKLLSCASKKAQGLSMNVIIIAAIALLVLVILSVLLLRTGVLLNTGTGCDGVGGKCIPADESCADLAGEYVRSGQGCPKIGEDKQRCCIPMS